MNKETKIIGILVGVIVVMMTITYWFSPERELKQLRQYGYERGWNSK